MKKVKRMLKIFVMASVLLVVFMVSASAGEVEFSGKSSTPVFKIDGNNVYCAEPQATHPSTGVEYEASVASFEILDEVFINDYLYTNTKDDTYHKVLQQVIWSRINSGTNYRMMVQVLLGEDACRIFDQLNTPVDVDEYIVDYTLYSSSEKDEMGRPYQQLVDATVKEVEPVVSPDPEPETEMTEPETEVTEPETEVTEPETEVTEPETEVTEPETEVTEPETELETEPETEPTVPVLPDEGPIVMQEAPKTGDSSSVALFLVLFVASATAFILVSKKKKEIINKE